MPGTHPPAWTNAHTGRWQACQECVHSTDHFSFGCEVRLLLVALVKGDLLHMLRVRDKKQTLGDIKGQGISSNITLEIKSRRLRWFCGTHGREEIYIQGFGWETCRKELLLRPGCDGKMMCKMGTREIGWEDINWIKVTQNRDKWLAVVKMVMNLQVTWYEEFYSLPVDLLDSYKGSCFVEWMGEKLVQFGWLGGWVV